MADGSLRRRKVERTTSKAVFWAEVKGGGRSREKVSVREIWDLGQRTGRRKDQESRPAPT